MLAMWGVMAPRLVLLASRRPMNRARSLAKAVSDFPRGKLEICCAFDPVDTVKGLHDSTWLTTLISISVTCR